MRLPFPLRSLCVLFCALAMAAAPAEAPGRFGFLGFPPAPGQVLGTASRPVSNFHGGFWFRNEGAIWLFDASGYRPLGPRDGLPEGGVAQAHPEPTTGMWFLAGGSWRHLGRHGLRPLPQVPLPGPGRSFLAVRNEGFGWIDGDRLKILRPEGGAPLDLPRPGPGDWVKGWKAPAGEERILVGDDGLALWDGRVWRHERLEGFLEGRGWDVRRDRSGALWVRSDRDLVRVAPRRARFGPQLGFSRNSFVSLEEDPFGRMWTNGPEGLACIEGDSVIRISEKEGLYGHHSYWPIVFDAGGSLWTISASGFQRMKGGFLWCVQEQPQGLLRAMIFTTRRLSGTLHAGTHDGLFRQDAGGWRRLPGTEGWALFAFDARPGGEVWACGNPPWKKGPAVLRLRPGQAAAQPALAGFPPGIWSLALRWVGPDEAYCGTMKGLYRITARGEAFTASQVTLPGAPADLPVGWLDRSADGTLWAACDAGLFRLDGQAWHRQDGLAATACTGTFAGPGGELWVLHDEDRAITRLAREAGGWKAVGSFGKDHPLTAGGALGGWTDPKGVVWLLAGHTVVRWDGTRAEHHTKAYGVPIDHFFENGIQGDPDGRFYVGSISGLVCFDPRFYRPIPPPPALEAFEAVDGEGRPFAAGSALPQRGAGVGFELRLPLADGVEDLQLETRLKGLEDRWRPAEVGLLRFPGLPGGKYVLEVRAARRDGQYGPVLSFPFRILRPWYLRAWAWALYVAALAGLGVLVTQWRTWALQRDRARLEGQVTQRTAELLRANADLTQALAEVKTLSGLVPICCYCKKIRDDDGFWSQLEAYIQERSDAQFSHGICPDCEKRAREELAMEGILPRREKT